VHQPARTLSAAGQGGRPGLTLPGRPAAPAWAWRSPGHCFRPTGRGAQKRLTDHDAAKIVGGVTAHFADGEDALGILTGLDAVRRQLGHTVAATARLAPLADEAPEATDPDDSEDSDSFTGDPEFASGAVASDDDSSFPVVPLVIGGLVVATLFAVVIRRSSSTSTGLGRSSLTPRDHDHVTAASIHSMTTSSTSGFDSSASSSPSFGGGSSDGGGATGSW
jgi:uncharacterized membrane protein YgcG